jgi:hypothetical protein
MAEVHLLENNNRIHPSKTGSGLESGYWTGIGFQKARCLSETNAWILFHDSQESAATEGAKRGGKIIGFRVHEGPDYPEYKNRIVLVFEEDAQAVGMKTSREGWQRSKKIVGCTPR